MPQKLLIQLNQDNQWEALLTQSVEALSFAGDTPEQQADAVKSLATSMSHGWDDVLGSVPNFFKNAPPHAQGADLAAQLFGLTNELIYAGELIYSTTGEAVLRDEIEAAGSKFLSHL